MERHIATATLWSGTENFGTEIFGTENFGIFPILARFPLHSVDFTLASHERQNLAILDVSSRKKIKRYNNVLIHLINLFFLYSTILLRICAPSSSDLHL